MTKPSYEHEKNLEDILKMDFEQAQEQPEEVGESPGVEGHESSFDFDILPEELEEYLNQYVVRQEETVEIIATKVCTHFKRMVLEKTMDEDERLVGSIKSNMLLIGPTGVGKTYIIKLIARRLGVPFVKADATKFSETGYVGGDVEDLVRELVHEAEGDITKAEYGIIYIDEIDKIASTGSMHGPDVSRSGVQRNLLKLMEEAEVDLKTPHDLASQVEAAMEAQRTGKVKHKKINTRNILFIVSGAFNDLDQIINRRLNRQAIGFDKSRATFKERQHVLREARTEDLIQYGFESEFIGRLPVYIVLNDLDTDGLYEILKNEYSNVILGKKLDFRAYGIELTFTDAALYRLAEQAHREKTGARGLLSVVEKVLIPFEKALPSTNVRELEVDDDLLDRPRKKLSDTILDASIRTFQSEFLAEHGIYLEFDESARDELRKKFDGSPSGIVEFCREAFNEYYHGIRLMKRDTFSVTAEAVRRPTEYLDEYIRENYSS